MLCFPAAGGMTPCMMQLGSLLVVRFLVRELKLSSQPLEVLGGQLGK